MKKIHLLIIMLLMILLMIGLNGCGSKEAADDANDDTEIETVEETPPSNTGPPYSLMPLPEGHEDPYPLIDIAYTGQDKLAVADDSVTGSHDLNLFIQHLKRAIYEKDAVTFSTFLHPDVRYTSDVGFDAIDFATLWPLLEPLMVFGCAKITDDHYVIPYMSHTLRTGIYSSVAIAEPLNMRQEPSIQGEVIGILYYDLLTYRDTSDATYVIDGIPYNWIQIQKSDGTVGYASDKYLYHAHSLRMSIQFIDGYWYITDIIKGD